MAISNPFKSTIFLKIVMAVTGLILVGFILGHLVGNLQIFVGREAMNTYAAFLQGLGELLWAIRFFLVAVFVLHLYTSIKLQFINNSARPESYKITKRIKSTLSSRTMIYSGLLILAFVIYHLLHFTVGVADTEIYGHIEQYGPQGLFERHDVYYMIIAGFQKPIVSIGYLIAVIILGFHLNHAIQSMFQTLGWSGPQVTPRLVFYSRTIAILVALGYASIPLSILFGLVGGNL
jgi:succinate dehydrogenase / fumarate reductase, cytochrome b subunit